MAKRSRDKGKVGERELAEYLRGRGFPGARRGQQFRGGSDSADVVGVPGLHIECKRTERLNINAAFAQAESDAAPEVQPAVFSRQNRGEWLVTVRADYFLTLRPPTDWAKWAKEELAARSRVAA